MRLTRKSAIISALCAALLAAILLALPPLIKHLAEQKIDEATGRKSQIAKISINPFTLSAGISGFRLSERGGGATFLSLSSARLTLSPLSLPKRAFIITGLSVASPYLHLVREAPNRFNFSDLASPGAQPKKKQGSYLYSLNNITVTNGSLDFRDRALRVEKKHRVTGLSLSVPFFSNMPYLAERYVTPGFSAVVNGTPVAFSGRLKPLTRAVEASIDLKVRQLDLPYYLGYLPFPLPVRVDSGRLTTSLVLGYRVDEKSGPETTLAGTLALDQVALGEPGGAPLAALKRGRLGIKQTELISRRLELSTLELEGVELFASRDRAGGWNFRKLGDRKKPAPAPGEPAPSRPLALKLARFSLSGGKLHLADALPKGGFRTDLSDIELSLSRFSTAPGEPAFFDLKFASARGETAALKGEFAPKPLQVRADLQLAGIPLKDYYPYLTGVLTAPVSGTLGVSSELRYNEAEGLLLERGALKGDNLAASFGGAEGIRLKEASASGIAVDLKGRKALVGNLELRGGNLALSREASGAFSPQRLLRAKTPQAAAPAQRGGKQAPRGKQAAPAPFSYRIDKIAGKDLGVQFTDRTKDEAPQFRLSRMKFSLAGISGPKQGAIPFTLASGFGGKGVLSAAGTVLPAPLRLKANLQLHRIALREFDAYISEGTTVFLADGALDSRLSLDLQQAASGLTGSFGGTLGVKSFYCLDSELAEDLLKWESLQLDKIRGTLGPFSLSIKDVSLNNFYARVIVQQDGTLNLQHLVREESPRAGAPQGTPASASASASAAAAKTSPATPAASALQATPAASALQARPATATATKPAPQPGVAAAPRAASPGAAPERPAPAAGAAPGRQPSIKIEAVSLQGGTLDFSDRHLQAPFDTTFYNLGGRVSGLSSEASRAADVDLRGNLESHSPLSITGVINPLRGDLFLDLKISFTDIELSPFTPYSNTYLGYAVDKGKLSLDLMYKIDKKLLVSQNKVFLDQFTFGKQVESEKATKLPVRLAVALLKDRKGEIRLDLPVAGQTNDPKFSVWGVVVQILKNLLVKAATSPVALLGSMFGGGDDFSAVLFAPGSSRLSKPEQDKLLKLSRALADRPALKLEISGFVDRDKDAEGYRREILVRKLKGEKFRTLVKQGKSSEGQKPETTELLPEEYPIYLKAVYAREKFPKPRNLVGLAKSLPDAEMEKLILTHTVVGDNELRSLARERTEAVRAFLQESGKLPAERLFEKSADIFRPGKEGTSGSRVEFGAGVR